MLSLRVTLLALVAIAQALSDLRAPVAAASGGTVTVTWSSTKADTEKMTLALYSTNPSFNGPFAVANNIDPQANKATLTLPEVVPGSGYSLALISMRDTSDVRARSPSFAVGPVGHPVTASSATQTTARKASTSAKGSATVTTTRSHAVSGSATKSGSHAVSSSVRTRSGSASTSLKSAPASARSTVFISSSVSVTAESTPLSASSPTVQSPSLATVTTPSISFSLSGFPVPTTGTSSNASPSVSPSPSAPNGASISASRFSSVRLGIIMFLGGLLASVVA